MQSLDRFANSVLRSPLLWGALLTVGFFAPIQSGHVTHPELVRYVAGHWIEYVEVAMFFVGVAALAIKWFDVRRQFGPLGQPLLSPPPAGGQPVEDAAALAQQLDAAPAHIHGSYLWKRLREAMEHVRRKDSADALDDEIKYLADLDYAAANQSFAFLRIIIWAIPILGFLGTVIGITVAIANLSPQKLEESLPEVTSGLGVAFDTTALALGLSMVLMFGQYLVEKFERRLLGKIDERVSAELVGRFQETGAGRDPEVAAVRRVVETLLAGTEKLVARQAELWHGSMEAANARWQQLSAAAGKQLETSLAAAIDRSLKTHATQLATHEQAAAEKNHQHWHGVQTALTATTEALSRQQSELTKQGTVLLKVVEATGQVAALEAELNRNLKALAGAKHFEETVVSLAAAVQLLSARINGGNEARTVQLDLSKRTGQAA